MTKSNWRTSAARMRGCNKGAAQQSKPREGTKLRAVYDEFMLNPATPVPAAIFGRNGPSNQVREALYGYGLDLRIHTVGKGPGNKGTARWWLVGYTDENGRYVDCVAPRA